MSSVIEDAVKSLVEFESALDVAKSEASDAKKRILKSADEWAESAKAAAISKAQQISSDRIARAKADVEVEAIAIRMKGDASLHTFEASISKHKVDAVNLVIAALLGERK